MAGEHCHQQKHRSLQKRTVGSQLDHGDIIRVHEPASLPGKSSPSQVSPRRIVAAILYILIYRERGEIVGQRGRNTIPLFMIPLFPKTSR